MFGSKIPVTAPRYRRAKKKSFISPRGALKGFLTGQHQNSAKKGRKIHCLCLNVNKLRPLLQSTGTLQILFPLVITTTLWHQHFTVRKQ